MTDNGFTVRRARTADRRAVIEIFNYYVENSLAAYPVEEVGQDFFEALIQMSRDEAVYVLEKSGKVIGFAILRDYGKTVSFRRVAETAYFILPGYTRRGLGSRLLETLISEARRLGIVTLLANISSENEASLAFHLKHGFAECGRFTDIGDKHGRSFDVVWMQRKLK